MQGSGERTRKSEAHRAIVQTGELGFYPLNSLALTALFHNQADSAIGLRGDPLAEKLRGLSEYKVSKEMVKTQGRVFSGFSDAFYRGKLPEVVVVTSEMAKIPEFIEEFMDFTEKLCALGFFTQRESDEIDVLDKYIPQIIIASYGFVFDVIVEKFDACIKNMSAISTRQRERLIQKLSRAIFSSPEEGYDLKLSELILYPKPLSINLAGSKSMYTVRTTQILENHQITCQFNPNGKLGILEWELNLAYKHLVHRLIPLLESHDVDISCTNKQISQMMDTLGQRLGILPGLVVINDKASSKIKLDGLSLNPMDLAILHRLKFLSKHLNLENLDSFLDQLTQQVNRLVFGSETSASVTAEGK